MTTRGFRMSQVSIRVLAECAGRADPSLNARRTPTWTSPLTLLVEERFERKMSGGTDEILSRYPVKRSALLPCSTLAQRRVMSPRRRCRKSPGILKLTPPQVYETATFYTMLNLKPVGSSTCRSANR